MESDRGLYNIMLMLNSLNTKEKTYLYAMVDTIYGNVGLNMLSYEAFPSLKLETLKICFEAWKNGNPAPDRRKVKVISNIMERVEGK